MFDRIVSDPAVLGGKPIIKGTRISVEFVLELVASGGSIPDIVRNYPFLTEEDVRFMRSVFEGRKEAERAEAEVTPEKLEDAKE